MPEPSVSPIAIYQLRVVLRGVSPPIWRRLLVVSETSLGELHEILQSAFGWSGERSPRSLKIGKYRAQAPINEEVVNNMDAIFCSSLLFRIVGHLVHKLVGTHVMYDNS